MRRSADWLIAATLLAPFALATARSVSLPGSRFGPARPFVRVTAIEHGQGSDKSRLFVQLRSGTLYPLALEVQLRGVTLAGAPPRIELQPEASVRVALDLVPGADRGPLEIRVREVLAFFDARGFDLERAAPLLICETAWPRGPACAFPAIP